MGGRADARAHERTRVRPAPRGGSPRLGARTARYARRAVTIEARSASDEDVYDENGVDRSLIRWFLNLSPVERLAILDPPLPSSKATTVVPSLVEVVEAKPASAAPKPIVGLGPSVKSGDTAPAAKPALPAGAAKPGKPATTYPELTQKASGLPQDKTRIKVDMREPLRGEFEKRFAKQKLGAPTEKFLHLAETQLAMESGAS